MTVEEIVESLDKIDRDRFKVMNKETRALAVAAVAVNSNGFLMARKDGGPQLDSNESLDLFDPKVRFFRAPTCAQCNVH